MKNRIFSLLLASIIICISSLTASAASYFYDDGRNNDNPNVDKFKPTSGVKIKESGLARMMENATQNAMDSSQGKKSTRNTVRPKQHQNEANNSYQRSYKWF